MKRIYNIMLMVSILALALAAPAFTMKTASAQIASGPYYSVNPAQTLVGPGPAIGSNFTVSVNLNNVTLDNAPNGINGVEVHFTWDNATIEPLSFNLMLGQPGGVLNGTLLAGITAGFYKDNSSQFPVNAAPYTDATFFNAAYAVSGATAVPWYGTGMIVQITFKVDVQPTPFANTTLHLQDVSPDYLVDSLGGPINHYAVDGNLKITTTMTNTATIAFNSGNYEISIASDSNVTMPDNLGFTNTSLTVGSFTFNVTTYDGFCNVTVPKGFMSGTFTVTVDGSASPNLVVTFDSSNSFVWFNFSAGTHQIVVSNDHIVPEFTAATIMIAFMSATLIVSAAAIGLRKRRLHY